MLRASAQGLWWLGACEEFKARATATAPLRCAVPRAAVVPSHSMIGASSVVCVRVNVSDSVLCERACVCRGWKSLRCGLNKDEAIEIEAKRFAK